MDQAFLDVVRFEKACGNELSKSGPSAPDMKTCHLRFKLISEEAKETLDALNEIMLTISEGGDVTLEMLAELQDGLSDLEWVAKGTSIAFGIDGPAAWQEVDGSNASKFGPGHWYDETGKLRKGPSFVPPDILGVLASQRPLAEIYGSPS